jgi:biopolymer transport protein ExbD
MSKIHKRGPAKADTNLTPLIDITFQVVLFFMLTQRIVSDEIVQMEVPDVNDPHTRELGEQARLIINIAPQTRAIPEAGQTKPDPLDHSGNAAFVKVGQKQFNTTDLEGIRNEIQKAREAFKPTKEFTELQVNLRCDSALFYNEIVPIMNQITLAGVETVNLVALLPEDQR